MFSGLRFRVLGIRFHYNLRVCFGCGGVGVCDDARTSLTALGELLEGKNGGNIPR